MRMSNKFDPHKSRKRGFSVLDRLDMPDAPREIVNWLARHREASFDQLHERFGAQHTDLPEVLVSLVTEGAISEAFKEGHVVYRAVISSTSRKSTRELPADLWARVMLDRATFLKQLPLFREMDDAEIGEISNLLTERRFRRDDVILWQGKASEFVYFIKSGIVEISHMTEASADVGLVASVVAYLKQGDTLGEINAINVSSTATATATAKSTVDVLQMEKAAFVTLLYTHPSIAVELTRLVARRLANTVARTMKSRLCLIIGGAGLDVTLLGSALAIMLSAATHHRSVYTEQPHTDRLFQRFSVPQGVPSVEHDGGFDVHVAGASPSLPPTLRSTLVLDQLNRKYEHIVMSVPSDHADVIYMLLPNADQVLLVGSPDAEQWATLDQFANALSHEINPEKTAIFRVSLALSAAEAALPVPDSADFALPYDPALPLPHDVRAESLPAAYVALMQELAQRLGRTNQISVFIPSTLDVDTEADTTAYVTRALAFLGERFGGATSNAARGVWNSQQVGLVSEAITIVRSYATQSDLNTHLPAILDFVETLKQEMRQEAMAVEINHKLLLI
jgi:CRP-like cAMP-binding protein